jgi:hypothetical protein
MKNYQKDFSGWCGECRRVKVERQKSSIEATKQALIKIGAEKSLVELASKSSAD